MKNCIYKITSIRNGKIYIGSAVNIYKRKHLHFKSLKLNNHHNIKLQRHCNKYGINDFVFDVIEYNIKSDLLIKREQHYIDTLNPFFNICKIAGSAKGRVHSQKTKNKISASLKNKEYTEERKRNMSIGRSGIKPKPFTIEHKRNMSISMKGKRKNATHKRKAIIQIKNGEIVNEFDSIKMASITTKINRTSIWFSIKNNVKTKEYDFKYK